MPENVFLDISSISPNTPSISVNSMVFDISGNLYFSTSTNDKIHGSKYPYTSPIYTVVSNYTIVTGPTNPVSCLAYDPINNNLFISNNNNNQTNTTHYYYVCNLSEPSSPLQYSINYSPGPTVTSTYGITHHVYNSSDNGMYIVAYTGGTFGGVYKINADSPDTNTSYIVAPPSGGNYTITSPNNVFIQFDSNDYCYLTSSKDKTVLQFTPDSNNDNATYTRIFIDNSSTGYGLVNILFNNNSFFFTDNETNIIRYYDENGNLINDNWAFGGTLTSGGIGGAFAFDNSGNFYVYNQTNTNNTTIAGPYDVSGNTIYTIDPSMSQLTNTQLLVGKSFSNYNVDISGNCNVVGNCNIDASLNVDGTINAGTINAGAITGTSLSTGSGSISGGAITGASLSAGSGSISTTGSIFGGAINGSSLSVGNGTINGGAITGSSLQGVSGNALQINSPISFNSSDTTGCKFFCATAQGNVVNPSYENGAIQPGGIWFSCNVPLPPAYASKHIYNIIVNVNANPVQNINNSLYSNFYGSVINQDGTSNLNYNGSFNVWFQSITQSFTFDTNTFPTINYIAFYND